MKVIKLERSVKSGFHIHAGGTAYMYYVPDLKVLFGTANNGTFSQSDLFISKSEGMLKEAEIVDSEQKTYENTDEFNNVVSVRNIAEADIDGNLIVKVIDNLNKIDSLKEETNELLKGIEL